MGVQRVAWLSSGVLAELFQTDDYDTIRYLQFCWLNWLCWAEAKGFRIDTVEDAWALFQESGELAKVRGALSGS